MPTRSINPTPLIHVLVVDDDEIDRESVRRLLARANIEAEVVEEADPLAALAILRRTSFDVVVLDYHFPRHDGLLILRELREFDAHTPVIMLTGYDDTALAVELMQNGAADYIPKATLNAQRLANSVRHALRLRVSEVAIRAVQEALRASEALNHRLLEASRDCVTVLGIDGRLVSVSAAGLRLLGITDDTALRGRPWLDLWASESAGVATAALAQARRGNTGRFQGLCASRTGAGVWWDVSITSIPGADGQPERLMALCQDLTEHDLLQIRLEGRVALERVPANIHDICRRIVDAFAQPHADRAIVHQEHGDGQGTWDPPRLAQAIGNLVRNAITYGSPDAPITVRSDARDAPIIVEVHNHGAPIADELRASVFQPFAPRGSAPGRVGLGLFLAREIVVAHGGDITLLHSTETDGTTFRIELPRA